MFVHDGFAYVAAQDSLAKVDVESGEITSIVAITGVNKFAVYNDLLIVSRQFPVTSDFVQIRQIEDLSLVTTFEEISDESWDISVVGDTAYISVAGSWAATEGKIAILDMNNLAFVREINLGELARGIGPSFQNNEHLFFVCKTPWGGTSGTLVKYELSTAGYSLHQYDYSLGKAAGIFDEKLFLMINGNIGVVDLNTLTIINDILIEDTFAGLDITALTIDTIAERIYVNYSYWVAPDGIGKIYDLTGTETGEYEVGISSEEVAVNYVDVTGVNDVAVHQQAQAVFPNPCFNYLNVTNIDENTELSVYDISGHLIVKSISIKAGPQKINISNLIPGIYFLKISDWDDHQLIKFIHQ